MLISKSKNIPQNDLKSLPNNSLIIGLITNVFNVKAFLFFVSLFTILIDNLTDIYFYVLPLYLSYILTVSKNKTFNVYSNKYLSTIMSLILCFIGLLILFRAIYEYF